MPSTDYDALVESLRRLLAHLRDAEFDALNAGTQFEEGRAAALGAVMDLLWHVMPPTSFAHRLGASAASLTPNGGKVLPR